MSSPDLRRDYKEYREPRAPVRATCTTVRSSPRPASPRMQIHGTRPRSQEMERQVRIKNFAPQLRESLSEIQARYPLQIWQVDDHPRCEEEATLSSWEFLRQLQSEFYESLRAEMVEEQAALRQDIMYSLSELKAQLPNKHEANNQMDNQNIQMDMQPLVECIRREVREREMDMQPLVECIRREVREAVLKTDMASQSDISLVVESLARIETSMRTIDTKPEVDFELKSQMNVKPVLDALQSAVSRIELDVKKNLDQVNHRVAIDMQPNVNFSPVLEAIEKLDGSLADVNRKQAQVASMQEAIAKIGSAVGKISENLELDLHKIQAPLANAINAINSKQDDVVAAVRESPKFQLDLNPLGLQPITDATARIERHVADIIRRPPVDTTALLATAKEIVKKPQEDLQGILKSIVSLTDQVSKADAAQKTNGRSMMDELAKVSAAQLEHKFAIEMKSQFDLKPLFYALAKLEQKVDKFGQTTTESPKPGYNLRCTLENTPTFPGLERGDGSGSIESNRSLEKELSDVLTLSGTSVGSKYGGRE